MLQYSKVSFEYVDFLAKMLLIFYPAFGNSKTKRTLVPIDWIGDGKQNSAWKNENEDKYSIDLLPRF